MTGGLPAGDLRILDLLTASEAGALLSRDLGGWFSADRVRALVRAGELVRVDFGRALRVTPESVEEYVQRLAAGAEAVEVNDGRISP